MEDKAGTVPVEILEVASNQGEGVRKEGSLVVLVHLDPIVQEVVRRSLADNLVEADPIAEVGLEVQEDLTDQEDLAAHLAGAFVPVLGKKGVGQPRKSSHQ